MAKSEGTSYSLADIIEKGFNPLALRYFFTQSHYRSKQNFTWEALGSAQTALEKLFGIFQELGEDTGKVNDKYKEKFTEAINDDFNVPQGVAVAWDMVKDANVSKADKKATLLDFDKVLGFGFEKIQKVEIPEAVEKLAEEREVARKSGDFKKSDELRDKIKKLGFEIKDTPSGYKISK
jgi:cysteinyl-tRNA synthetase